MGVSNLFAQCQSLYLLNTCCTACSRVYSRISFGHLLARKLLFEYQQSRDTVLLLPFWVWVTVSSVVCDALFRAYQEELVTRRRCLQVMAIRL